MANTTCLCYSGDAHCLQLDVAPAPRLVSRPWLVLVPTYPQHFHLALNLCRSLASFAVDHSETAVRLVVGDGGEAALYRIDITGYNERRIITPSQASDPAWSPLRR